MKKVAKLVIIDENDKHLLMYRSNHPTFGNDPDLPGGTLDGEESLLETMIREVQEEIGLVIGDTEVQEIYSGADYSAHGTHYALFVAKMSKQPEIEMSWEHASYHWLDYADFLAQAKAANDTYMHMVHDALTQFNSNKIG